MSDQVNQYRVFLENGARSYGPFDPITRFSAVLGPLFEIPYFPFLLLVPISTFVLGALSGCTFGLALLPFTVMWWALLGLLMATSWLWVKVAFLRPFLLLPGVGVATFAGLYAALMPEMGEWQSRATKQALCNVWPHSIHVFRFIKSVGGEEKNRAE
jgi:hypothetical protein